MKRLLTNLFGLKSVAKSKAKDQPPARRQARPQLEHLEDRLMLTVWSYYDPYSREVYLHGDVYGNTVEVRQYNSAYYHFRLDGRDEYYPIANVGSIRFSGGDGNDTFRNFTNVPTIAYGHDGSDTFVGGGGRDEFYGGQGWDYLYGMGGNDVLYAGSDTLGLDYSVNVLEGGNGSDYLLGDMGSDYLYGGWANGAADDGGMNWLHGYGGTDTLTGGVGTDFIYGYEGDDYLNGGLGMDYLYGMENNDTLNGGNDGYADQLYGGTGADKFYKEEYWVYWYGSYYRANRDAPNDYAYWEGDTLRTSGYYYV